jgi:hypothetical protein
MGFPVFQLDVERVEKQRRLFPDDIDLDEWTMFHGTSGTNAEAIERDGFDPACGMIVHAQIRRIADLYEKMKWGGSDGGGYPVLRHYSLNHNLQNPDRSILFFAETSMRALLYASHDFAGGEKLRALRHAFADLGLYLRDQRVRDKHRDRMEREFNELSSLNAPPHILDPVRPVVVDPEWLRREVAGMSDIRSVAEDAFQRHEHGVVYALRMSQDDVGCLHWSHTMGIETTTRISASKIVGKVIVPAGYGVHPLRSSAEDVLHRLDCGIIAALRAFNK